MSLDSCLSIASSGISVINAQLALVSQNVANAGTSGYVTESSAQTAVSAAGQGMGVLAQPATLQLNTALQASLLSQNAAVASLTTQQTALQQIDGVIGTPGSGNDLASQLGALQDAFSTLLSDPSSATQQQQVVANAQTLAEQINAVSGALQSGRQTAQDSIVTEVGSLNQALATIGQLNTQITNLSALGQSTAGLQNSRNTAMGTISQLIDAQFVTQPDGTIAVLAGGTMLPTDGTLSLQTSDATMSAANDTPPPISLGGTDITGALTGGTLGGNVALRDTILPTGQAELDEFAETLSTRFASQGLTLFTDPTGNVPAGGGTTVQSSYIGYAGIMQVNPLVRATPSLVRDGTTAIAGSPTGATAFTPNDPTTGPAGFTTLISRVLNDALGSQVQANVTQPAANTSGLGASGTLSAPFDGTGDLATLATDVTSAQATLSANVTTSLTTETAVQSSLQSQLTSTSGVNMDAQLSAMISLQNAYGANARIIAAVQAMYSTLVAAVS